MLIVYAAGTPLTEWLAWTSALAVLPAEVVRDALKRSVALRDIGNIVSGQQAGAVDPIVREAADIYARVHSTGTWSVFAAGVTLALGALALILSRIDRLFRARNLFERFIFVVLLVCALIAILTTIGILFSVVTETWRFFFDPNINGKPTVTQFLFGTEWNPQAAMRADQGDIATAYGFVPLLVGTLLITFIAMCVAGPLGLLSAIYLSEYASPRVRAIFKPILETLAGIPTVVLGFFAALTVAPFIRGTGESFGLDVASESALAAGLVMGMMIIPFISSLSDDVINAVPQSLRDGSYALGSTKSETIRARGAGGRPAGHRLGLHAGHQPRHRRDHDRRHGCGVGRQPDVQSAPRGDDHHRSDQDHPGRRPGVRQRQDAGRLRPGLRAVLRDAHPQLHRAAHRQSISRAI